MSFRSVFAFNLGSAAQALMAALRQRRFTVWGAISVMVVSAIASTAYAVLAGPLVATLATGQKAAGSLDPSGQIGLVSSLGWRSIVAALIVASAVRGCAELARARMVASLQQGVVRQLREDLFGRMLRLAPEAVHRFSRGELATRLNAEIHGVRVLLNLGLVGGLRSLVVAIALATVTIQLDSRVATWGLLGLPIAALAFVWIGRRLRLVHARLYRSEAGAAATTTEAVSAIALLQAYGAEAWAASRLATQAGRAESEAVRAERLQSIAPSLLELLVALSVGAGWFAVQLGDGSMPPPRTISAIAALVLLYRPLQGLAVSLFGLVAGAACLDRIDELLALPTHERPDVALPVLSRPTLHLEGVRFAYGEHEVLSGVDLRLEPGETVALIGPSGAGKTTLLRLLAGVLLADAGSIQVGEGSETSHAPGMLRRHAAWMPQDNVLFADTVLANIALGEFSPNRERAEQAARLAEADAFIRGRPGGYDASVRETGSDFSAGQRQRLCLARALYKDAPILLLDEPTSALDAQSESAVIEQWDRLKAQGMIIVVATHHTAIAEAVDRVCELHDGRLVQRGDREWKERLDELSRSA